jgi:hypothetical protein
MHRAWHMVLQQPRYQAHYFCRFHVSPAMLCLTALLSAVMNTVTSAALIDLCTTLFVFQAAVPAAAAPATCKRLCSNCWISSRQLPLLTRQQPTAAAARLAGVPPLLLGSGNAVLLLLLLSWPKSCLARLLLGSPLLLLWGTRALSALLLAEAPAPVQQQTSAGRSTSRNWVLLMQGTCRYCCRRYKPW